MTIKDHGTFHGDRPGTLLIQSGVRTGRVTIEAMDGDTAKVHLQPTDAREFARQVMAAAAEVYVLDGDGHTCIHCAPKERKTDG